MAMVVTRPCIGCKDKSCIHVCPAECFRENADMLYIDSESCIDCAACIYECPVEAIFHEDHVPPEWMGFIQLNAEMAAMLPSAHT